MTRRQRTFLWACVVVVVGTLAVLAGCGGGDDNESASGTTTEAAGGPMKQSVGEGEGRVDLIAWAGYVEDGSTDKSADWVTDFEKETGCQVNVKIGGSSDEMVTLMRTGNYDGVSASGDATLRLIAAGDVAPVNTEADPELRRCLRRAEEPEAQLRQRRHVRRARTGAARTCSCGGRTS